jgi:hypothetical protein
MESMEDPRYPIGKFQALTSVNDSQRRELIQQIAEAPARLRATVQGMSDHQLDTPYREGGWTVRQVAHHLTDSHMNAYIRIKLALTENEPTIKPYEEKLWAELVDARTMPVEPSLQILESLHKRWVLLLRSLAPSDFSRTFRHPQSGVRDVDWILQLYAWHGRHHVAHITSLKEKMKW